MMSQPLRSIELSCELKKGPNAVCHEDITDVKEQYCTIWRLMLTNYDLHVASLEMISHLQTEQEE